MAPLSPTSRPYMSEPRLPCPCVSIQLFLIVVRKEKKDGGFLRIQVVSTQLELKQLVFVRPKHKDVSHFAFTFEARSSNCCRQDELSCTKKTQWSRHCELKAVNYQKHSPWRAVRGTSPALGLPACKRNWRVQEKRRPRLPGHHKSDTTLCGKVPFTRNGDSRTC